MNIFILSENPVKAAKMHCDQHLHKMILESAQMLSTYCHSLPNCPNSLKPYIYKPAYQKHPCTIWLGKEHSAPLYLLTLAFELENIRHSSGFHEHSSIQVLKACEDFLEPHNSMHWLETNMPKSFAEAMPAIIKLRNNLTTVQKYQEYYKFKAKLWAKAGRKMTFKHNHVPEFMIQTLIDIETSND